jgi:hypothetical protein
MVGAAEWWGSAAVAAGAIGGAIVAGRYSVRREREARIPAEHHNAVEGYDKLTGRLDGEIARLGRELSSVRQSLAAALAEVDECERSRHDLEQRVATLELQLVHHGLLERRKRDDGPPDHERRQG